MGRSSALFVSAAMVLAACSAVEPRAVPAKIKPLAPAAGPQENCDDILLGDPASCVAWTPPEPHNFSMVFPINEDEAGVGKEMQWGPYYWCAVITDEVAENVLGTKDVVRVVTGKYSCEIAQADYKQSGLDKNLRIHLAPNEPGNGAYDWFVEPNPLGQVTQVKGRKAVRTEWQRFPSSDHASYVVEIPERGSVWNVELRRQGGGRTEYTADYDDADRRILLAIDALMVYDRT